MVGWGGLEGVRRSALVAKLRIVGSEAGCRRAARGWRSGGRAQEGLGHVGVGEDVNDGGRGRGDNEVAVVLPMAAMVVLGRRVRGVCRCRELRVIVPSWKGRGGGGGCY